MSNVSVHIIARNSMGSLPDVIRALHNQTYYDLTLRVADNASSDNVIQFLRGGYTNARVIRNARSIGTSSAQNQLIRMAMQSWKNSDLDNQYVLMLDNDITLEPDAINILAQRLRSENSLGAVGGKILRMFDENIQDEALHERVQSDRIDSMGLYLSPYLDLVPRGAGEVDSGQYDGDVSVFAVPGSMMMIRASALVCVRHSDEEYMDQHFGSGGEDKDLSWRLNRAGFGIECVPSARAYRYRGVFSGFEEAYSQNDFSMNNHFSILIKNLEVGRAIISFPRILVSCIKNFREFTSSVFNAPVMLKKRKTVFNG